MINNNWERLVWFMICLAFLAVIVAEAWPT